MKVLDCDGTILYMFDYNAKNGYGAYCGRTTVECYKNDDNEYIFEEDGDIFYLNMISIYDYFEDEDKSTITLSRPCKKLNITYIKED